MYKCTQCFVKPDSCDSKMLTLRLFDNRQWTFIKLFSSQTWPDSEDNGANTVEQKKQFL